MRTNVLTLLTVARGSAVEVFQRDLTAALANCKDLNTPTDKVRKIQLEVRLLPLDEARETVNIEVHCKAVLAPVKPAVSTAFLQQDNKTKEVFAVENNPNQAEMFIRDEVNETTGEITHRAQ